MLRLDGIDQSIPQLDPVLVCNEAHRFLVADQAIDINKPLRSIILEPEGRNTAPALTVVAQALLEQGEDAVMVMMPVDHIIVDIHRFQEAIKAGYQMAEQEFHKYTLGSPTMAQSAETIGPDSLGHNHFSTVTTTT